MARYLTIATGLIAASCVFAVIHTGSNVSADHMPKGNPAVSFVDLFAR
jgi:hypothetical protein